MALARSFPAAAFLLLSAVALEPPAQARSDVAAARADIISDTGEAVGRAHLVELPAGVLITLDVSRLFPGVHAVHIHETGRCDRPSFESAGGHFNPDRRVHGFANENGPHAGDLPNIYLPEARFLKTEMLTAGVTLTRGSRSLFDADGSALVIHIGPDDYRSDPAGVSGSRVACGVIISRPEREADPKIIVDIRSILVPMLQPQELAGRRVELPNV